MSNIHALTPQELLPVMKWAVIGIAGIGGLGSHAAAALARTGAGTMVCADFDVVEASNINRQYYFLDQIGMRKVDALSDTLRRLAPTAELVMRNVRVTEKNAAALFGECHVILECFDTATAKAELFDAWAIGMPDKFYIGSSGVAGYREDAPVAVKKLSGRAYIVGDLVTDAAAAGGLTATRVGIAAHMQANLAVNLLLELFQGK